MKEEAADGEAPGCVERVSFSGLDVDDVKFNGKTGNTISDISPQARQQISLPPLSGQGVLRPHRVVGAPVEVKLEDLVFPGQRSASEDTNIIRQCRHHVQLLGVDFLL